MRRRRQRGFTLIELMIALVLFALVAAGMMSVAVSMASGAREQELNIATESSARAAMDFMTTAIRGAIPGVPFANIRDANTDPCPAAGIVITNNAAPVSPLTTSSDQLTMVFAIGSVVTSLRSVYDAGTTSVTVTDASQFSAGDGVLITNLDQGHLVRITGVAGNTLTLANQVCSTLALPSGGYPPGALVVRALRATLSIGAIDGIPTLMMDPDAEGPLAAEPLAEGIEDMQVAVGVDNNGDGALTELGSIANDDEWLFNVAGESLPVGSTINAIRITLVARATKAVVGNPAYLLPAVEDRVAGTAPDAFRRRVLTSTVEIRNHGGSP